MMIYVKTPKSKVKKVPKAQREQYEQWLKSHQPKKKVVVSLKNNVKPYEPPSPYIRQTPKVSSFSTWSTGALTKVGIMKDYHKLSEQDREKVDAINSCVAPLHKSNYVYVSEGMNPASLGRKNEVL